MRWFRKIRDKHSLAEQQRVEDAVRLIYDEILRAYGDVLENKPSGIGGSRSEDDLPFPKAVIKNALIEMSKRPDISREYLNALSITYLELAAFLPEGGHPGPFQNLPKKPSSMSKEEIMEFAKDFANSSDAEIRASILQEQEILFAEWQKLSGKAGSPNA